MATPLFATWLGYLTAILACGALLSAFVALATRRKDVEHLSWRLIMATAIGVAAATLVALALYQVTRASDAIYTQVFLAATLFTLALALADWRGRAADVLWNAETRLLYLAGQVGCVALSIAIIWMG